MSEPAKSTALPRRMLDPRLTSAKAAFRRQLIYLVVAGFVMVAAALIYLASWGPLTGTLVVTATFGVFVSIALGGGLMAAGFFSADSGHDDLVAESTDPIFKPAIPLATQITQDADPASE